MYLILSIIHTLSRSLAVSLFSSKHFQFSKLLLSLSRYITTFTPYTLVFNKKKSTTNTHLSHIHRFNLNFRLLFFYYSLCLNLFSARCHMPAFLPLSISLFLSLALFVCLSVCFYSERE